MLNKAMLDSRQVMTFLGIGETKFYELIQSGELPARKIGREWRVAKPALLWYSQQHDKDEKGE